MTDACALLPGRLIDPPHPGVPVLADGLHIVLLLQNPLIPLSGYASAAVI